MQKNNNGETPLHNAVYYAHREVKELLISKGADVNAKSNSSKTSLDMQKRDP